MPFGARMGTSDGIELRLRRSRDEDGLPRPRDPRGDRGALRDGLPFAEDDLGEAAAQLPVVVDPGVAEVLERKRTQPIEGRGDRELAGGDGPQDSLDLRRGHGDRV